MELAEAIKRLLPLQVLLPDRCHPMQLHPHAAAEVFLAETARGPAVIWFELGWCDGPTPPPDDADAGARAKADSDVPTAPPACRIAYAYPRFQSGPERWVDEDPMYGPHCIPWQKPVILERLLPQSPFWHDYQAWQGRRRARGQCCARLAAWQRVEQVYGELIRRRVV